MTKTKRPSSEESLRILAVAEGDAGSNSMAFVHAMRRAGHSVHVIDPSRYLPTGWKSPRLRLLRKSLEFAIVKQYEDDVVLEAKHLEPDLFFAFKGTYVTSSAIKSIKKNGAIAINFFPDVSITAHGKYIPNALPLYDWIFTTKTFGLKDMRDLLGVRNASFLPHGFDPEVHRKWPLSERDRNEYASDISFIGTWSPKKEQILTYIAQREPNLRLRIWGAQWEKSGPKLKQSIENRAILGREYAKCIQASKINLALLSEARANASSGDLITSRTFHIPASGGLMLHERTAEVAEYFTENKEFLAFTELEEVVEKCKSTLADSKNREKIAFQGLLRSNTSGYAIDYRIKTIMRKYDELNLYSV